MKIAYKIFKNEIDDLFILYESTIIAYEQTKILKHKKSEDSTENKLLDKFSSNVNSLSFDLRQLILIKLISIIEKYLIDNIKYIFTKTKEPFRTNNVIEFQHQELLSFKSLTEVFNKIITKDCRQLSSGGFDKIVKYYHQKFNLNLNTFFPQRKGFLNITIEDTFMFII